MENKNCKTNLGESYDTDEWMSQYYSSEGGYYSLYVLTYLQINKVQVKSEEGAWTCSPLCEALALRLSPTPL